VTWISVVGAVLRRPRLWPAGVRAYVTHVPSGWHRRRPFLPVPDRAWMRFRLQTQYGDSSHAPEPDDVVTWLEWSRGWRSLAK
jgi:hypothetical protein